MKWLRFSLVIILGGFLFVCLGAKCFWQRDKDKDDIIVGSSGETEPIGAWTSITVTNAPEARATDGAVWTGTEMIVWNGFNGITYLDSGAKYYPITDSWVSITTTDVPSPRNGDNPIWTGTEMIIWGGTSCRS